MKNILVLLGCLLIAKAALSQKTFEEAANLNEKQLSKKVQLWKIYKIDKFGRGNFPDLTKKEISKVVLVAYTISTPLAWNKYGPTYNLNDVQMNFLIADLYAQSIENIKAKFASEGIELLTIENLSYSQKAILTDARGDSFLKNEEKSKNYYTGYNKLSSKQANLGLALKGYKNWKLIFDLAWPWSVSVLGKMANALDADAVLLINHEIEVTKNLGYSSCLITMAGMNPIPKIEGRKYPGLSYNDGMVYGQSVLRFDKPIEFASFRKKAPYIHTEKFGDLMGDFSGVLLQDIKKHQAGNK